MSRKNMISRRLVLGGAAGVVLGAGSPASGGEGGVDQRTVDAVARRFDRGLIALRRSIHARPELAGQERRTAALVADRLRAAGCEVVTGVGGHGVVGVLRGARPGRRVAYRADMDAVPAAHQVAGQGRDAHVCGHDLHTAVGVGIAQVLGRLRRRLSGEVALIFQPGEENLSGARAMLAAGVLERTRSQEIHALHCGLFPVGRIAVTPGTGLPGQDHAVVALTGADAGQRARRLADELKSLATVTAPGTSEDIERLVADLQTPDGPLARFVALNSTATEAGPDGRAEVRVSYRCWPPERHAEVRADIRRLAGRHADTTTTFPADPFPALVCPEPDARALARWLRRHRGADAVPELHAALPFSGEDFALFLDRLPGTYSFLGVRKPKADIVEAYPHFGAFDPDERAIGVGVRAMAGWLAHRALPTAK